METAGKDACRSGSEFMQLPLKDWTIRRHSDIDKCCELVDIFG